MTDAVDEDSGEADAPPKSKGRPQSRTAWAWRLLRFDVVGIAFAALFSCLSLTPSLMPRRWLAAGLIGGVNAAIGYGLGVVIGIVFYRLVLAGRRWWPPSPKALYAIQAATVIVSIGASVLMLIPAAAWQRQISVELTPIVESILEKLAEGAPLY